MSDPFDMFERLAGDERRAALAAAKERNERDAKAEESRLAIIKAETSQRTLETNEWLRLAEYDAQGVKPPVINGVPTKSSISLLKSLGWTITDAFGQRQMMPPPDAPQVPGGSRGEYERDQNT